MLKKQLITTLVVILCFSAVWTQSTSQPSAATGDPVTIFSVVTTIDSTTSTLEGSLMGGTAIYVKGVGFDPSQSNNQVFVGTYPCIIALKGATIDTLTCDTTAPTGTETLDLPVSVIVAGKSPYSCEACQFSYTEGSTPILAGVYPRCAGAYDQVKFYGIHRITDLGTNGLDMGDVQGLYIGQKICSRFNIIEAAINANDYEFITCAVAPDQEGGFYNVTEWVTPGYAQQTARLLYGSIAQNISYQFIVQPQITTVSSHSGGEAGQTITIQGTGFSTNSTNVQVTAAGIPCTIQSSTQSNIVCQVGPNPNGNTFGVLSTNTTGTQINGFISGSGLNYTRYDITNLSTKSVIGLRNAINGNSSSITIVESSIKGDLQTPDIYDMTYAQVFKGYFNAPTAGDYIFRGLADDMVSVYMSNVSGSAEISYSTPLIQSTVYSQSISADNYYYVNYPGLTSAPVTLAAGEMRYIEIYHLNTGGAGNLLISVEVPNTLTNLPNQVYTVQQFSTQATVDPQILTFTQQGANSGNITFKVVRKSGLVITYNVNQTINWNATASQFTTMLNAFDSYNGYNPVVTLQMYDSTGNLITNGTPYTIVWTVTIAAYRATTQSSEVFTIITTNLANTVNSTIVPTVVQTTTQNHSPPISGSYSISLDGYALSYYDSNNAIVSDIPYNTPDWQLQAWMAPAWNCSSIEVTAQNTSYVDGVSFIVAFVGCNGNMPAIVSLNQNLQGGRVGTQPTVTVNTLRAGSTNLLMEPVTVEYLFTNAAVPQVQVTVNNVLAKCQTDCSYQINAQVTPILNSATLDPSTSQLTLSVSDPGSIGFTLDQISVSIDTTQCRTNVGLDISSFTCTVNKNPDNSPIIRAGSYIPVVEVKNVGFAQPIPNFTEVPVTLIATSTTGATVGLTGGIPLGIIGHGFPFSLSETFSVTLCNQSAVITSVDNTQIGIMVPPCDLADASSTIVVSYNGQTATLSYNYDPSIVSPSVTGISPTSFSPVLKGTMTINGSGFGTDMSQLTVYLVNSTGSRVYQMNVLSANDTQLSVKIPGGQDGTFTVTVNRVGFGDSVEATVGAGQFIYEIVVTSVSPTIGSSNGGTVLTITGRNFCPLVEDNQAYIGNAINWNCDILTANATTITCITPPQNSVYNNSGQPVTVTGRALIDSTCEGTCTFTYNADTPPTVSTPNSLNFVGSNSYTLTGTGFVNNGITPTVIVGDTTATVTSSTNTSVTFIYPMLRSGAYPLNVYVDGIGYAVPTFNTTTSLNVTGLSNQTGSRIGNIIYLQGNGLIETDDPAFSLTIKRSSVSYPYTIIVDSPNQLGVQFMGGSNSYVYTFNYTYGNTSFVFNYTTLNTSTVSVTFNSPASIAHTPGLVLNFTRTNLISTPPTNVTAIPLTATGAQFTVGIPLNIISASIYNGSILVDGSPLGAGKYNISIYFPVYGYGAVNGSLEIQAPVYTVPNLVSSYQGGKLLTVSGNGLSSVSQLSVGGLNANLVSSSSSSLVYQVPPYVTQLSQDTYNIVTPSILNGTPIADKPSLASLSFDGLLSTEYTSTATTCYIGLDFGPYLQADITRIRYYPDPSWISAVTYMLGANFSASNDNVTWDILFTVDSTVHTSWNIWRPSTPLATYYRYVRYQHNSTSACKLAEFEVMGILYSGVITQLTSNFVGVQFTDGYHSVTWAGQIEYRQDATSLVTSITPTTASPAGGQNITLTGSNFGNDPTVVSISVDGIPCVVQTTSDTQIVCTVGARDTIPAVTTFDVSINQNFASLSCPNFTYAFRWSDPATWGGDIPPIDGDTVYIPPGMVLLVDQSTPNLKIIIVEGTIIFADQAPMTIETGSIIVNFGTFTAGTEQNPYQNQLTFLLHGGYYDSQLPGFGNKAIGCHCCKFDMYGTPRLLTWTELAVTANVGDTNITLTQTVDWAIGELIVIASTSADHYEAERRTITSYDNTTGIVTFDDPLLYKHISVVQTFGSDSIPMRAEVGLLTRNILVTGDSDSVTNLYGAHIMMHGPSEQGLVGHIAYIEVTQCGQPAIIGRYCIHFHMNGDVSDSYVIGNSVHDSYARVLTLHGVHYLTVESNVGHLIQGHSIFLEDGIESYNVIQNNLIISTLQVWNMLQTDISAASYWITNPLNTFRNNRAAGSDFYGIWYEIKPNPDGVSATSDICPTGMPIGECHDNIAHSNVMYGLRIFQLHTSVYPCEPYRNDWLADPWSQNPSVQNTFYNFVLYQNGAAGLLAEEVGNTIFTNFTIADSGIAGMQFHLTNISKELVMVQNNIIIGQTVSNGLPDANLSNTYGIITPRSDGFMVSGMKFYNFPATMTVFQSCSECDNEMLSVTSGRASFFQGISYSNVLGNYIKWNGPRRNIFYDIDGSLSSNLFNGSTIRPNSTILPYYVHNDIAGKCFIATNQTLWNTSLICDNTSVVRTVMITNAMPSSDFSNTQINILRLQAFDDNISNVTTGYTSQLMVMAEVDKRNCWAVPFVLNNIYDAWWNYGIDWTSIAVVPSVYFNESDVGMIIRFNYTEHRELFEITQRISGTLQLPYITAQTTMLNTTTCNAGDYFHDPTNRYLYLCISGKNKPIATYLDLNGIYCLYLCPQPAGEFIKQPFIRQWSNASQWPGGVLPSPGDNVTVNGNWTIIMDMDPAPITYLTIDGDVYLGDRNTSISADVIFIRAGSLNAGTASDPFNYTLTITLNGNKSDQSFVIDPIVAANKYMVVTGELNLYGIAPSTVWTTLTAKAAAGATAMSVGSTSGWAVGDQLVIGPSFQSNQSEFVTITAVTSTSVSFTPALNYTHYGDTNPLTNSYGTIDMRAAVGHITRNIQIVRGADPNTWGFRVLVYGFMDGDVPRLGSANLNGVQFVEGGQYDTQYAALHFQDTPGNPQTSSVTGCSFVNSGGYAMNLDTNANITIDNNVFYIARKFIVTATNQQDYAFTNNLMIGAKIRISMAAIGAADNIVCYYQYTPINWDVDNNFVSNNLCQGSDLTGFVFPFTPCEYLGQTTIGFIDNTAGLCVMGFMFNLSPGQCIGGEKINAYSNSIGYMAGPPGPMIIQYQNFMLADNGRGMALRHGYGAYSNDNNTGIFKDSWVSGAALPNCNYCYGTNATDCTGNYGLRMMVSTINGEMMPDKFNTNFDVVCQQQAFDSKAFLINVTFDNYRQTYTGNLSNCSNNVVFMPHPLAHDLTASHHLTQTFCTNCEQNAWAYFTPPDPTELGWLGGCGLILCTGMNNYIIQDHDGSFMGSPGTILANNSWLGAGETGCTFNPSINGYICNNRSDFAVLQYESIAPDFNTRIMWPVTLTYWGGNWTSVTNGFREWDWNGAQPNNHRIGRFISVVRLGQVYNMTFAAQPPSDMRFQIQRRTQSGNNSDWIAINIYYPVANAILVLIGQNPVNSTILATSNEDVTNRSTICGASKYFYKNGTIAFIVTGDMNCQVRVTLSSNVQITSRLMVSIDTFFNNGGVATFLDMMCAFLNITTDRLKVVGVYSGSTIVDFYVTPSINTTAANSSTTVIDPVAQQAELQAILDKVQSAAPSSINLGALGPILSSSGSISIINTDGSIYQPSKSTPSNNTNKVTIIIAVVVSILSVGLVAVTTFLVLKKLRNRERIEPEDSERPSDLDIEVHKEPVRGTDMDLHEKDLSENKSNIRLDR